MSTAGMENGTQRATETTSSGRRVVTQVTSLDEIVGAHPEALRAIYATGRPTDPAELGELPRGRLLAVEGGQDVFIVTRGIVRALASNIMPWQGKVFDHGGNGGQNVVFGRKTLRFRTELGPSLLDGKPTLFLRYDSDAFNNPRPLRKVVDELRTVAPGVAIGPAFWTGSERATPLLWFGLSHR